MPHPTPGLHNDGATSVDHPIVTIGHDWGGVLSLGWASRNTDLVSASISLNTAVHQPEDAPIPAPSAGDTGRAHAPDCHRGHRLDSCG